MPDKLTDIENVGQLKERGWKSVPVKEEIRRNLIRKIKSGETLFPEIRGYDKSVIPQLQHALLSKHDLILLGLRGQAKTKILRLLVNFLDEYIPVIKGSEINDNPLNPVSKQSKERVAKQGDETPVEWIHRNQRYGEKLATPDTTVADLIGDIDPIKAAAEKLALADENVINFGLVPRTNRGVFAINELPDLQPRIQVALLNIMQERDIQIRGFNVRIPLDVLMVFSANPEDYTNRGNIITPLKDRIDSQIMTHYPREISIGMDITEQEAWTSRNGQTKVHVPELFRETIEQAAFEARESEYIDQKSGVSTRMTITAMEQLISSAERRALINNEQETWTRTADFFHIVPALTGKLELKKKDNNVYKPILDWFAEGNEIEIPDHFSQEEYKNALLKVDGLQDFISGQLDTKSQEEQLVLMDFVLEALHQHSMLGKEDLDDRRSYSDMLGSMLGSVGGLDDFENYDQ